MIGRVEVSESLHVVKMDEVKTKETRRILEDIAYRRDPINLVWEEIRWF